MSVIGAGTTTLSPRSSRTSTRVASCLWNRLVLPTRRALRCVAVFLLLLCAAESLLSLAVYFGYRGGTYLRRVDWHRDGSLSFAEFQREVGRRPAGGASDGDAAMSTQAVTVEPDSLPPCPLIPPGLREC